VATRSSSAIGWPASDADGIRVLVNRLWPCGLSRRKAAIEHWLKDIAPSTALRRWYGHDIDRGQEFKRRYRAELDRKEKEVEALRRMASAKTVTLLYAARVPENNAAVLAEYLRS
jgi:uncharacterized protein YeaO (DUF488 family)